MYRKDMVICFLEQIKEWRNARLDDENRLIDSGYIKEYDTLDMKPTNNGELVDDIIVHYSMGGMDIMINILGAFLGDPTLVTSESYISDIVNDYVCDELSVNDTYELLRMFCEDCSTEELVKLWKRKKGI